MRYRRSALFHGSVCLIIVSAVATKRAAVLTDPDIFDGSLKEVEEAASPSFAEAPAGEPATQEGLATPSSCASENETVEGSSEGQPTELEKPRAVRFGDPDLMIADFPYDSSDIIGISASRSTKEPDDEFPFAPHHRDHPSPQPQPPDPSRGVEKGEVMPSDI